MVATRRMMMTKAVDDSEEGKKTVDKPLVEDSPATPKRRRKRSNPVTTPSSTAAPTAAVVTPSPPPKKVRSTPKKASKAPAALNKKPPSDWESIYQLVEELRSDRTAPCDHSGCEALPDRSQSPRDFRFQVLISLMLSSQTKDAVVGEAIRSLQSAGVLDVESVAAMDAETLNSYIRKVGFHNNKTKYIQQTVQILLDKYNGDLPPTAAAMIRDLPGVGPKMAYICENVAWATQSGIGVDTHMHRLFPRLGWVNRNSKSPEHTRVELEAWLPLDKWADVNLLWVGFGQELQQFKPKLLRKALDCSQPAAALRLLKRCGLDVGVEGKKLGVEEEVREALKK